MIKKFLYLIIFVFLLFTVNCLLLTFSYASEISDPSQIGIGARALGMGKAHVAIADDASSIFINPAGLSLSNNMKIISMSGNLISEVPYTMIGGSFALWGGSVGIGYIGSGLSGIQETTLVSGTPEMTGNSGNFSNSEITVSYSRELNLSYVSNAGATIKLLSQGFTGTASFDAGKGSGIDIDLGTITKISDDMNIGVSLKNIIPGNNMGKDEIPMTTTVGISRLFKQFNLLTAIDAELSRGLLFHAGAEWSPIRFLKVRAGLDQMASAGSSATNLSAGLGIVVRGFTFDYAYHGYSDLSEFTTHYFSIGYEFLNAKDRVNEKVEEKIEKKIEEKKSVEVKNGNTVKAKEIKNKGKKK